MFLWRILFSSASTSDTWQRVCRDEADRYPLEFFDETEALAAFDLEVKRELAYREQCKEAQKEKCPMIWAFRSDKRFRLVKIPVEVVKEAG